jgi:hypothetical protein
MCLFPSGDGEMFFARGMNGTHGKWTKQAPVYPGVIADRSRAASHTPGRRGFDSTQILEQALQQLAGLHLLRCGQGDRILQLHF